MPEGERDEQGNWEYIPRPPQSPPPCDRCPKGGPENEHLYKLTNRNLAAYDLYNRSQDKYFEMPEHLRNCKFRQSMFAAIEKIEKEKQSSQLTRDLSASLSKWVTKPK